MSIPYNPMLLEQKQDELCNLAEIEYIKENNTDDIFEESLNDTSEPVIICGQEYYQGTAYRKLDPIGFNCALSDNEDSVREAFEEQKDPYYYRDEALTSLNMLDEEEE
jgi:hypothetical protein